MDYDSMSTVELRAMVRERALATGGIVASARKNDLIALLRDGVPLPGATPAPAQAPAATDLADVIAQAISGKINTGVDAEQVTAIVDGHLDELYKRLAAIERPLIHEIKLGDAPAITIDEHTHACFERVLKLVSLGLPVLLVGPAGTGKTTLAAQVAKALGRRFSFNSLSAGCSESHLIGRTLPDSTGNWCYKPAPFVTTYKEGGVHLFDEIDAADPNLMVLINAALANGHLSIPFEDMIIERHKDTAIIAAANTYGTGANRQYVGRNALDAATLDRFSVATVEVGYDQDLERKLVSDKQWLEECWRIRAAIEANGLRRIMSTRTLVNGQKRLLAGDSIPEVLDDYFAPWARDEVARVR